MRKSFLILAFLPMAACASTKEAVRGPQLAPMSYPAQLLPQQNLPVNASARGGDNFQAASANSLWRQGARAFFVDQRANRVGDILTVQIDIDDKATTTNSSTSSRSSSTAAGVSNFLGFETSLGKAFPAGFDPANAVGANSDHSNAGSGAITRQEKISLTVAAVVTTVLPNGNLVINGTQEVRTNNEVRHLSVDGIVRPEDITAANTIKHTQIASARIDYGGRGDVSRVQKTPAGQSLIERFSPF